jgi:hypothetical protein
MNKPEPMLWLSDARGVYIPRDFAQSFVDRDKHVSGLVKDWDGWTILENPDHEWYWEAWQEVCDSAIVTDDKGNRFRLYQEGDLWLIPVDMEWCDEDEFWKWPEEETN